MASDKEKLFIDDIDIDKKSITPTKLIRAGEKVGEILSINIPQHLLTEKGFVFAGYKDIPGEKTIKVDGDEIPLFASTRIDYPGQPVFIATHPDPNRLNELCSEIEIIVKEKAPFDIEEELPSEEAITEHLYKEKSYDTEDDLPSLFHSATTILENNYSTGPQEHYYTGHQGVIIEKVKDSFKVTVSTEWLYLVRESIARVLDIPIDSFTVFLAKNTPSFYGKLWFPALIAAQLAVLFKKSQKRLQLIFNKEEDILYTTKRAPLYIHKKSAFNEKNELIAEISNIYINAGAYPAFSKIMLESAIASCKGLYKQVPCQINAKIIKTNTPSMDFLSGTCVSPVQFANERHIDFIANYFHLSPYRYRIANLSPFASKHKLGDLIKLSIQDIDYERKHSAKALNNKSPHKIESLRYSKGIGISCGFQGNGYIHSDYKHSQYTIRIEMKDANHLNFYTSTVSSSNKTINIWKDHLSQAFNVPLKNIDIISMDSWDTENIGPPFLYSKLYSNFLLINQAAKNLKSKIEKKNFPIEYTLSLNDLPEKKAQFPPFKTVTFGACSMEVKLDPITHDIEPSNIFIAINCGKLQNKEYAKQRIRISVEQSLQWIKMDQKIHIGNHSVDFVLPSLSRLPKVEVVLIEDEDIIPKGIVEVIFSLVPAAFCAAASQAVNKEINSIPILTDLVKEED